MPPPLHVNCPAKINTTLRVLARRSDGYHELDTEFVGLELADELVIEPEAPGFSLVVAGAAPDSVPIRGNLVLTAASALQARVGEAALPGARFRLTKRIPAAAGLGGGSSDAAGTLLGLCRAFELDMGEDELAALALEIGSDVPYFLRGGRQRGFSRGERLEALPDLPSTPVLLVNPRLPLSTREVFLAWDRLHDDGSSLTSRNMEPNFASEPWSEADGPRLHNDLWGPALAVLPQLENVARRMREQLPGWRTSLTGSGPTLFAIPGSAGPGDPEVQGLAGAVLEAAGLLVLWTRTASAAEQASSRFAG